jgi:hypothetical protein
MFHGINNTTKQVVPHFYRGTVFDRPYQTAWSESPEVSKRHQKRAKIMKPNNLSMNRRAAIKR